MGNQSSSLTARGERTNSSVNKERRTSMKQSINYFEGSIHSISVINQSTNTLLAGAAGKDVVVVDWENKRKLTTLNGPKGDVTQVLGAHGPDIVYGSSRDHNIYQWKLVDTSSPDTPTPASVFRAHGFAVTTIAGSEAHKDRLCSGSRDTSVTLWDTVTSQAITSRSISRNLVTHMKWINDESCILQCSEDKLLRVWDIRTLNVVQTFPSRHNILTCCECYPDGKYFITGERGSAPAIVSEENGIDRSVYQTFDYRRTKKIWDRRSTKSLCEIRGHRSNVTCCKYLSAASKESDSTIVSSSDDGSFRVWRRSLLDYECLLSHTISVCDSITAVEELPQKRIVTSSLNSQVTVWQLDASFKEIKNAVNL